MVPVVKFLWASSVELTAVINPYGDGPSEIASPEPQKDCHDKDKPKKGRSVQIRQVTILQKWDFSEEIPENAYSLSSE